MPHGVTNRELYIVPLSVFEKAELPFFRSRHRRVTKNLLARMAKELQEKGVMGLENDKLLILEVKASPDV